MRIFSGQEVCKILAQYGYEEIRQRGSHIIMQRKIENSTITIPVPNHKEIRTGTLMSIIRQSRLDRSNFEVG
ncbi:MAG: type II toxin-antitoxin system HicA family toxin [Desulfobacterales bacterium]